ncbi:probable splicing factor YJU2B [Hydra vulgaris]|uniref:Probable splicing factor YJU2B n=1 Tax=Hydra vulgaris TaxID=6087 RepID=A0ABM4C7X2_HYDVU
MGERKGVNKYYPPDYDPSKGGLNKFLGTHALRERARKLHEGILIIRFEMPFNVWCLGCNNHIGMGVRYNAQKRKMGNYYTTPIYKFRMKCHLCDQHFEIQTDPKNCDYLLLSGCRRKEERWDTEAAGNVQSMERGMKQKLMSDAMFKLEHQSTDTSKAKKVAPTLTLLEELREDWSDDFRINQLLREKFRNEKKEILKDEEEMAAFKLKSNLPEDLTLVKESEEDIVKAKRINYGEGTMRPDLLYNHKKRTIKQSSIFDSSNDDIKVQLAKSLARNTSNKNLKITPALCPPFGVKIKPKSKRKSISATEPENDISEESQTINSLSFPNISNKSLSEPFEITTNSSKTTTDSYRTTTDPYRTTTDFQSSFNELETVLALSKNSLKEFENKTLNCGHAVDHDDGAEGTDDGDGVESKNSTCNLTVDCDDGAEERHSNFSKLYKKELLVDYDSSGAES